MIRIVMAVFLLLAAACTADPSPATIPPPSGHGRFTGTLDPCSLLTADQVEQLVTLAEQTYDGGCSWSTPSQGLEGQAIYELKVGVHLATDVAAAHSLFTSPPETAFPRMVVKALPRSPTSAKVGDESFVLSAELSQTTVLAFRLSNAVVNINYGWRAKPDPRHLDRAQQAARWVAEALDQPSPTADPSDGRFATAPYACSLLPEGASPPAQSATRCGGLTVRHARAWGDMSGIAVAKKIFTYYRKTGGPARPVRGLGDEAFSTEDGNQVTVWVRVSNLVLEIKPTRESSEMQQTAAEIVSRLPGQ